MTTKFKKAATHHPSPAALFMSPVLKMLILGCLFAFILMSSAHAVEPTAEELLAYARGLATRGQAVKLGTAGIVIRGESIEGVPTRRPSDAIARAAELTMETAISSRSQKDIDKALGLWKQIDRSNGAIAYLRMAGKGTDSFSGYCQALLATIYAESGDIESAKLLFDRFDGTKITDDLDAISVALAARFSLAIGDSERAGRLARAVIDRTDPNKFAGYGGDTSVSIAKSVLKVGAPSSAAAPQDASRVPVRGESLERARTALAAKDYEGAISAFIEHRRLMPSEPSARDALLQAAELSAKLQQTARALGYYREAEVQYSSYPEGWKAAVAAASLLKSQGNLPGALKSAEESLTKAKTPEASAWITLKAAELAAQAKAPDKAAAYYADLLSRYSSQDAARDVFQRLQSFTSQIKDWKKLVKQLQEVANSPQLSKRDLSRLRRMILGIYVGNGATKEAKAWLATLSKTNDDGIEKDQAWLSASTAQQAAENCKTLSAYELTKAIQDGLDAARFSPKSEEALAGLRAATTLVTIPSPTKRTNRELESNLRTMMDSDFMAEARALLIRYYEFLGDSRSIMSLK